MPVDHEAAWLALKSAVADRQGIGRDGLYALMARLEVEHAYEEEVVGRLLRRYGFLLQHDLRATAREAQDEGIAPSPRVAAAPSPGTADDPSHRQDREEIHDEHPDRTPVPA